MRRCLQSARGTPERSRGPRLNPRCVHRSLGCFCARVFGGEPWKPQGTGSPGAAAHPWMTCSCVTVSLSPTMRLTHTDQEQAPPAACLLQACPWRGWLWPRSLSQKAPPKGPLVRRGRSVTQEPVPIRPSHPPWKRVLRRPIARPIPRGIKKEEHRDPSAHNCFQGQRGAASGASCPGPSPGPGAAPSRHPGGSVTSFLPVCFLMRIAGTVEGCRAKACGRVRYC